MAGRKKGFKVDDSTREKIQATKLVQRLQGFALGHDEPGIPGKKIEMSPAQVKAAHILINKRLPDLTAADLTINDGSAQTREEMFEKLKVALGEELALKIAPEFAKLPENATIQ